MPSLLSHFYRFMIRSASYFDKGNLSTPDWRARAEQSAQRTKIPAGESVQPVDAGEVPAEWDIPAGAPGDRVILYIHGGAWIFCSPRTHRSMVFKLAQAAGIQALSIDYRLAPENPFPAALDDCLTAYRWLLSQGFTPEKIVIAGDSAGGNLTLATLVALRDAGDPLPAAAVCLSPATDLTSSGESVKTRADVDIVLHGIGDWNVIGQYLGMHDPCDPHASPLFADLHGLPPVLIHVGDHEILLDDATRFVERARAAGVDARVVIWPAMWHVFQMQSAMPEAKESIRQLGAFIREKIG